MTRDQRLNVIRQITRNFLSDYYKITPQDFHVNGFANDLHHALFDKADRVDQSNMPDNAIEVNRDFMREYGRMKG